VKFSGVAPPLSGVSIPDTAHPSTGGGGNVIGMLNSPTRFPSAFAAFQIAGALTLSRRTRPSFRCALPSVNPKIPCLPGFTPVKIEVHPGGV
jgi:hypothetical protein